MTRPTRPRPVNISRRVRALVVAATVAPARDVLLAARWFVDGEAV
ncbi:hypothetical protein [Actinoalloteichus spitiensis]|nr:hypothetical protein [Actinoalloteichus spitiensis]